jgi:HEAT repeat protein
VLVSDSDDDVRAEAAKALAQVELDDAVYVSMLLSGLKDPAPFVRVPVARLLGRLEDPRVVRPLVDALQDRHWKVRRNAENALVSMGVAAVPSLIEQLAEAKETTLLLLIGILGEIGDPRAVEPLEKLRASDEASAPVRATASLALGSIAAAGKSAG